MKNRLLDARGTSTGCQSQSDSHSMIELGGMLNYLWGAVFAGGEMRRHVIVMRGGMVARKSRASAAQLSRQAGSGERVIGATGRFIGEGFDDAKEGGQRLPW